VSDMVEQPAKVLRMGTMARQLPVEVHAARLDEASRVRLREIHERSIKELERGLAEDLRDKLNRAVHRGLHSVRRWACASRRLSWSAGWRACFLSSRPRCSPSRWLHASNQSRCPGATARHRWPACA
jgi:hypothetical protein